MPKNTEYPRVGVGVILVRGDRVLMGLRKSSHGEGTWGFPGGHLEYGETPEECAKRELKEETGIVGEKFERLAFTNDIFEQESKHYITLFIICQTFSEEPKNLEPEKLARWEWFSWDEMPENLFLPIVHLREMGYSVGKDKK